MKHITEYVGAVQILLDLKAAKNLDSAIKMVKVPKEKEAQVREYFGLDVEIQEPSILRNSKIDPKTLIKLKPESDWVYTEAYGRFLKDVREWDRGVVENIIHSSSQILKRFPDPSTKSFTCKGLVVGYVQSGKTASMASLMNLAADHGYKFVIVLAGLLKDLRLQTQDRLDQEVTGYSETIKEEERIHLPSDANKWVRLTQGYLDSDFKPGTTQWDPSESKPKLIVMKKLPSIINSLTSWLKSSHEDLKKFPVLLIDDESDHATIDTNYAQVDDEGNPVSASKTNEAIRELVKLFPKCVYVGYTATPFANFFIDSANEQDLYPKDFICVLEEPSGYWGARKLFGLGLTPTDLSPEEAHEPGVDLIELIDSNEVAAYKQHPEQCPAFLREAIYSFILTSLARLARGQVGPKNHFSMLVHPSRLKNDHEECKILIKAVIDEIEDKLRLPSKSMYKNLVKELQGLWESKFQSVTKSIGDKDCIDLEFEDIWKFQKNFFEKLKIIALNSNKSNEKLNYSKEEQRIYIVIGGDKLSRGLTLEGLCVSVFFRNLPNAYDTALQMGRWFGYRKGYHDLTRVYVENHVAEAFGDLARVELELRHDLKKYAKEPNPPTPLELFPLVRSHPALEVTSRLKFGAGKPGIISYQGTTTQTVSFPLFSVRKLKDNITFSKAWVKELGKPQKSKERNGTLYFKDISSEKVIEFLQGYQFSNDARSINSESLIRYITAQNKKKELKSWDIILPIGTKKNVSFSWAPGISTHTVNRSRFANKTGDSTSIKILSEGPDIKSWRSECGRDDMDSSCAGIFLYVVDKKSYQDDPKKCLFRPEQDKEDVLGFVIQFPRSNSSATVGYVTQG